MNRRCVARFCGGPTRYRGVACEVHWEILSLTAQRAVDRWLDERHPRGGGATTIPEALFAVSSAAQGLARAEWSAFLKQDIADGMYDDEPEIVAAVMGRHHVPELQHEAAAAMERAVNG